MRFWTIAALAALVVSSTAADDAPPSVPTRALGGIVLRYCGEPAAIQIVLASVEGPAVMTLVAAADRTEFALRLAKLSEMAREGFTVYSIELKPGCSTT